jgi:hypothetical protein
VPVLQTTIEVDNDAIVRALLEHVQSYMHGPEFSVSDVVTFTPAAMHELAGFQAKNADLPDSPTVAAIQPGTPAVVARYNAADPYPYTILVVGVDGVMRPWDATAAHLTPYHQPAVAA